MSSIHILTDVHTMQSGLQHEGNARFEAVASKLFARGRDDAFSLVASQQMCVDDAQVRIKSIDTIEGLRKYTRDAEVRASYEIVL